MIPTSERSEILVADQSTDGQDNAKQEMKNIIDVTEFGASERKQFGEKLLRHVEDDNLRLLHKIRERLNRVNVKLPTIEVRYKNLCAQAECEVVHGKPLPTLWNTAKGMLSGCTRVPGMNHRANVHVLKDISGIIKPSRMTLLLGPPGSGKTTMLRALAGRLDKSMKVTGEVDYNGFRLDEFVPQKTSAYVSQQNLHVAEMTVRETLDFSARFQGVGGKSDLLKEVIRREKEAGITPDIGVDTYMKATWLEGLETTLQTDYVMKIMGLDSCANTMVGDAMRRGISGGEKKRLTTAEMIVGPSRALFMDEISTGLDSTTTFRVVSFLQQLAHIMEYTVVVSLLQPAQEIYELFDDVILMDEGKIIYHGPRSHTLDFFQECGFKCPERKGTADFLQEVLSKNDQEQYWNRPAECYNYVTVHEFSKKFKSYHIGQANELSKLYDKSICNGDALSFKMYSLPRLKIFGACFARELLLLKRNLFTYVFKSTQTGVLAIITGTIFLGTDLNLDILHANHIMGSISYTLILQLVNALPELALTTARLPVFYKQRDLHFYPAWAYAIPPAMIRILISLIESIIWTSITYSLIGYSPEISRFFGQLITITLLSATSSSAFRFVASYFQTHVAAALSSSTATFLFLAFGGFILPRSIMTSWSRWGFWLSPVAYAEIGLATNEFLAPRWQKKLPSNTTIGRQALKEHGMDYNGYYYWISTGALVGYMILCNIGFSLALTFKRPVGASRIIISHEEFSVLQKRDLHKQLDATNKINYSSKASATNHTRRRMALPFIPLAMSFEDVNYYVDTPQKRLQLLQKISGSLRPGILSALMGVTGAGKTTLLDVLSGRKTGGITEGDIRIGGFPKVQATFARVTAYCEQIDIHSTQVTVEESLIYSAWLRLPPEIDPKTRNEFVNEVLETIELDGIRDALVGRPGVDGLSIEQRKRLTVAVELVSNPSIIFMDEPTSGLDARAAAVVMRAVKNIAETGRTIVCTIHQPSIDIFEAFDEVILMKKGGELIYNGPLGRNSCKVVEYFQQVSGVPRIKANYNPATWMMEVTSTSVEMQLEIDFAKIYQESPLHQDNLMLIKQLSTPYPGSTALSFPTPYARNRWEQFKACLWKQYLSYWRSPSYNLTRIMYMFLASITYGVIYWRHGNNISTQQDLFSTLGCMFAITLGAGINSSKSVMAFIAMERTVMYRETFAGMYSSWAYSFAQVAIEIPFVLLQVALFMFIAYPAIGFSWTAYKFFWFFYALFFTILYFVYFGMLLTSVTPNVHMAVILSSIFFTLQNLFSGYIVPMQRIPKWWIWFYYMSPLAWTLNGLFTSQFGDVEKEIAVFGENKTVASFLEDYFGFYHNHLPMVAFVLLAFPLIFASLFACFITKLNFQRR